MSTNERQYECIVFGASGYTGKYTAEHIVTALPTDFRWAVAGRSEAKLKRLVDDLRSLNPDRKDPAIEIVRLEKADLLALAKKTKILISTVGPYYMYGTVVVEACAETGTHYLDVSGESPWVYDITHKYHDTAKKNGAIMIPQIGVESAPADLMSWSLVSYIRQTLSTGTAELVVSLHELKAAPSGGTLASLLGLFECYSLGHVAKSSEPYSLCPVTPPAHGRSKSLLESLAGVRTVTDLGILTTSLQGAPDATIVNRTWGLMEGGKYYGPNFRFGSYMRVRNALLGVVVHLAITFGLLILLVPPIRWILRRIVYQPGQGPTKEEVKNEQAEWRAVAYADNADPNDPKRAFGSIGWEGSLYHLTGVLLAEAAITLSRDKTLAHDIGGGVLTPATLGAAFVGRLQQAGVKLDVRMMP